MTDSLQPYFYPNAHLGFLFITFLGELVFMAWLLIPRLEDSRTASTSVARGFFFRLQT